LLFAATLAQPRHPPVTEVVDACTGAVFSVVPDQQSLAVGEPVVRTSFGSSLTDVETARVVTTQFPNVDVVVLGVVRFVGAVRDSRSVG